MEKNKSLLIAAIVFALIAFVHLIRAVLNLEVKVTGITIPVYASYLVAMVIGYLGWMMFSSSKT